MVESRDMSVGLAGQQALAARGRSRIPSCTMYRARAPQCRRDELPPRSRCADGALAASSARRLGLAPRRRRAAHVSGLWPAARRGRRSCRAGRWCRSRRARRRRSGTRARWRRRRRCSASSCARAAAAASRRARTRPDQRPGLAAVHPISSARRAPPLGLEVEPLAADHALDPPASKSSPHGPSSAGGSPSSRRRLGEHPRRDRHQEEADPRRGADVERRCMVGRPRRRSSSSMHGRSSCTSE